MLRHIVAGMIVITMIAWVAFLAIYAGRNIGSRCPTIYTNSEFVK